MEQSAKLPRERYKANTPWNELGRRQERPGPTAPVVNPYTSFCISTEFKDVSGNGEGRRDDGHESKHSERSKRFNNAYGTCCRERERWTAEVPEGRTYLPPVRPVKAVGWQGHSNKWFVISVSSGFSSRCPSSQCVFASYY